MPTSGAWSLKGLYFLGTEQTDVSLDHRLKSEEDLSVLETCLRGLAPVFSSEDSKLAMPKRAICTGISEISVWILVNNACYIPSV